MLLRGALRVDDVSDTYPSMWRHELFSIKMAVSCAVHLSAQRFCFDAAVQTVDVSNMSDD